MIMDLPVLSALFLTGALFLYVILDGFDLVHRFIKTFT